jgi:hypothetical protein
MFDHAPPSLRPLQMSTLQGSVARRVHIRKARPVAPFPPDAGKPSPLRDLMATLARLGEGKDGVVRLGDVMAAIGERSHAIALLLPAMILVSPLSGIFGLPTLTALLMVLIIVQALMRRKHLWLPRFLRDRTIRADRFRRAIHWLEGPVAWVGRHSHARLHLLAWGPMRLLPWLLSLALCLVIPLLEFLPLTTSVACLAISLMALGLVLRDGLYVLAGYVMIGAFGVLLAWLLS